MKPNSHNEGKIMNNVEIIPEDTKNGVLFLPHLIFKKKTPGSMKTFLACV